MKQVWVTKCKETENGIIGTFLRINESSGTVCVMTREGIICTSKENVYYAENAPIDEKNVMSDWISEYMLEDCSHRDNVYLGWMKDYNNKYYPIYCENNRYHLCFKHLNDESKELVKDYFNEYVNGDSDNNVVADLNEYNSYLEVNFYFIEKPKW